MNIERKCWGTVKHVVVTPNTIVSLLSVNVGTRCSKHLHRNRANQFHVLSGAIVIEQWEGDVKRMSLLVAGESLTVRAGVKHRFRVWLTGHVVEVYYAVNGQEAELIDIVRDDEGGDDNLVDLRNEMVANGLIE